MNKELSHLNDQGFILTQNSMGHMLSEPDEYNQYFIDYCANVKGPVLDIGCAYGVATIPALKNGAYVIANDIEYKHLEILKKITPKKLWNNLELKHGCLPDSLEFKENSLEGVLASRVLHFLTGEQIIASLNNIFRWLKPGHKFFFIGITPYTGNFKKFIPIFEERHRNKEIWPGYMEDSTLYLSHRKSEMPLFLNLFDHDLLEKILLNAGFEIEKIGYIKAKNAPKDLILDGREHVGAIAVKP